jgi:DNA mismatch repair ATPase MutL
MWPINGPVEANINAVDHLPSLQAHLLRASTALTSLWHAIEICAINSIEAGSSEVHVEVDTASFSFKIVDNGHGLSAAGLKLLGTTWNITSKHNSSTQHVGIGLASICSTAVVEIISRAAGSFETHSCLLRAGELVQLKLAEEQKPRCGTTIIARDMFFNRPITRKSLANER